MDAGKSSLFVPEVPHFFKFMLDEDMVTGKLAIPKKFVRKYGTHLRKSNNVLLKVPTGDTWEVELGESNGVFRLEKGWPEFLEFYTIEHGDFLIFRYESGSLNELEVVVCNKTCTEVEYPKKSRHVNIPPVKVEEGSEDEVTAEEARERQPSTSLTRRRSPLRTGTVPFRRMAKSTLERKKNDTRGPLRGMERAEALNRAKSFKSSKPYFLAVMQPHYVRRPYTLNIPIGFAKQHMGQKARGEMKLHTSGDKIWTVGYTITEGSKQACAKVVRGWTTFVKDNDLALGDVCAFELIKGLKSTSFKITIFKAPSSHSQAQPAPLFDSEHPFFQVVMKESYISSRCMHIPIGFMRDHIGLECKECAATLKVGGDSFPVKFTITRSPSQHKALLCGGFRAFQEKSSLEAGDTCTFELIQRAEVVFRVSITKANIAAEGLTKVEG